MRTPKLRRNGDGRAFAVYPSSNGRRAYFGEYGTAEADQKYQVWLSEVMTTLAASEPAVSAKVSNSSTSHKMGKLGEAKHASELRWGIWSPDDVRKAAGTLIELANHWKSLASEMEKVGIERLRVDGDKKHENAIKGLRAFGGNIKKAMIDYEVRH